MANVKIKLGFKDTAWFAANATFVLEAGQTVYISGVNYPKFKRGDGVTQLQNLAWNTDAEDAHFADTANPHSTTLEQVRSENNQIAGNIDANGNQIDNLINPSSNQQASTKAYTDAAEQAAKAYADALVVGLLDDRGNWDASGGLFPSTNGSGPAGAILKGDIYLCNIGGNVAGEVYDAGDWVRATQDSPGQDPSKWASSNHNVFQATESALGVVKLASQAEIETVNSTEDTKATTPKKFWQGIAKMVSVGWTWAAQQIFTSAPRFSSVSANNVLTVDGNKDLSSEAKNTAFNKNFGFTTADIPEIGTNYSASQLVVTDSNKKTKTSTPDAFGVATQSYVQQQAQTPATKLFNYYNFI